MGITTLPLMPSTVTTKVLLVASTAKLFDVLMVGVAPVAMPGVEVVPRVATDDLASVALEKPSKVFAIPPVGIEIDMLD